MVGAARGAEAAAAETAARAACSTEQRLEQVAEVAVAELDAHVAVVPPGRAAAEAAESSARRPLAGLSPRGPEAVVLVALVRIAQDVVGLRDVLEALLGARLPC
jgi:hypothetical protein